MWPFAWPNVHPMWQMGLVSCLVSVGYQMVSVWLVWSTGSKVEWSLHLANYFSTAWSSAGNDSLCFNPTPPIISTILHLSFFCHHIQRHLITNVNSVDCIPNCIRSRHRLMFIWHVRMELLLHECLVRTHSSLSWGLDNSASLAVWCVHLVFNFCKLFPHHWHSWWFLAHLKQMDFDTFLSWRWWGWQCLLHLWRSNTVDGLKCFEKSLGLCCCSINSPVFFQQACITTDDGIKWNLKRAHVAQQREWQEWTTNCPNSMKIQ